MKEIVLVSRLMKKLFKTSKLNVEKIGNIVPQLHIHIISRKKLIALGRYLYGLLKEKIFSRKLKRCFK